MQVQSQNRNRGNQMSGLQNKSALGNNTEIRDYLWESLNLGHMKLCETDEDDAKTFSNGGYRYGHHQ